MTKQNRKLYMAQPNSLHPREKPLVRHLVVKGIEIKRDRKLHVGEVYDHEGHAWEKGESCWYTYRYLFLNPGLTIDICGALITRLCKENWDVMNINSESLWLTVSTTNVMCFLVYRS